MSLFVQQVVDGITTGSIYGALGLALVLVYRSSGVVNLAQGEMAMFATYIMWTMSNHQVPVIAAIAAAMAAAFVGGMAIQVVIIRRVEKSSPVVIVIVTLGLLVAINSLAGFLWTFTEKSVPSPFPAHLLRAGDIAFNAQSFETIGVLAIVLAVLTIFFRRTKTGLAMRASACDPLAASLVGIRVERTTMVAWGFAAALGALAGSLVAPQLFLSPNMMEGVLLYSLAAAALGGFDSPIGVVVGGLIVGVTENLVGTYVPGVHADLRVVVALAFIFAILVVRPSGLFGKRAVTRA